MRTLSSITLRIRTYHHRKHSIRFRGNVSREIFFDPENRQNRPFLCPWVMKPGYRGSLGHGATLDGGQKLLARQMG